MAISSKKKRFIHHKHNWECVNCGCGIIHKLTVDHIKPKSKGGTNDVNNLQTLCFKCNQEKADLTPQ